MKTNKKKAKKIILAVCICVSVILIVIVYNCIFGGKRYSYEELPGGIDIVYGENTIEFATTFPQYMGINFTGMAGKEQHEIDIGNRHFIPGKEVLFFDEETGYPCYREYVYFTATPYDVWNHSYYHKVQLMKYSYDGKYLNLQPSDGVYTSRTVEIYYLNPDGSTVLLWKRDS